MQEVESSEGATDVRPDVFPSGGRAAEVSRASNGKLPSLALFIETANDERASYNPLYTLAEKDKAGYPSARRIYIEIADPTEYKAAMALLGSWTHWQYLCTRLWFKPHIESWRAELAAKLMCRAVEIASVVSRGQDATALSAAKWLHAQLQQTSKNRVGRPEKAPKGPVPPDSSITNFDYERLMNDG